MTNETLEYGPAEDEATAPTWLEEFDATSYGFSTPHRALTSWLMALTVVTSPIFYADPIYSILRHIYHQDYWLD